VRRVFSYQSRFGDREAVTMTDGSGNVLVWFASGPGHGLREGRTYEIIGTVKKHDSARGGSYEGAKQTTLSRVKVVADFGETVDREALGGMRETDREQFEEGMAQIMPRSG
jgi:hypothetical protein